METARLRNDDTWTPLQWSVILAWRQARGMISLVQIARRVGCSEGHVSQTLTRYFKHSTGRARARRL